MKPPAPAKPRHHPSKAPAGATTPTAAWKRWLAAVGLVVGGGASAAWGIHDTAAWIIALRHGDAVITTAGVILGIPILGGSLCAIGPLCLFPQPSMTRSGKPPAMPSSKLTAAVLAVLGAMAAGIVLIPLGGLAIDAIMVWNDYRACHTQGHGRITVITWAAAKQGCPAPDG